MTSVGQTQASVPGGKPEQSPALVGLPWICTSVARGNTWTNNSLKNSRWWFPCLRWLWNLGKGSGIVQTRSLQVLVISFLLGISVYWIFLAKFALPLCNSNLAACFLDIYLVQAQPTCQKTHGFPKSCKKRPLYHHYCLNSVASPFFASSLSAGVCAPLHYCSRDNFL